MVPFAGIGLEHLCKAYLARLHPTLIAERGGSDGQHFDTLLHLLGTPHSPTSSRVRTVGGGPSLDRFGLGVRDYRTAAEQGPRVN